VKVKWTSITSACAIVSIDLYRVNGYATSYRDSAVTCSGTPTGTGCAAMKQNTGKTATGAATEYTDSSDSTYGYAWYTFRIENKNPWVHLKTTTGKQVVRVPNDNAPGPLHAACTLSASNLAVTVTYSSGKVAVAFQGSKVIDNYFG